MPMPPARKRSFSARDPEPGNGIMKALRGSLISTALTRDQTVRLDGPAAARQDAPHRDSILSLVARIPAQRVLPDPPGRKVQIDVRARVPPRQAACGRALTRVSWTTSSSCAMRRLSTMRTVLRLTAAGSSGNS